jgi:hypothetical protein
MNPSARQWVFVTLAVGICVGVMAGAGTYLAAPSGSAWAAGLNAGLLAATFLAILWYSLETRRLVDGQRETNEIARHPWLAATSLKPDEIQPTVTAPLGGLRLWLPSENHGTTPAYISNTTVEGELSDDSRGARFDPRERPVDTQVIVPGDFLSLRLGSLIFTESTRRGSLNAKARIEYQTADGGSGELSVGFIYRDGDWTNLDTTYRFTLRSGGAFPREVEGR